MQKIQGRKPFYTLLTDDIFSEMEKHCKKKKLSYAEFIRQTLSKELKNNNKQVEV